MTPTDPNKVSMCKASTLCLFAADFALPRSMVVVDIHRTHAIYFYACRMVFSLLPLLQTLPFACPSYRNCRLDITNSRPTALTLGNFNQNPNWDPLVGTALVCTVSGKQSNNS